MRDLNNAVSNRNISSLMQKGTASGNGINHVRISAMIRQPLRVLIPVSRL
jgi:hypothetical protein